MIRKPDKGNLGKAEVAAGDVLVLDCGIPRDVEALTESAFLLTICWPNSHVADVK